VGQGGILVVKKPWPSMIRTIWGDPERFKKSYYPDDFQGHYYLAGDGAIRDAKTGYFTITGRIDDVLNVSGHRMGTMEIESGAGLVHRTRRRGGGGGPARRHDRRAICAFVVLKRTRPTGDEAKAIAKQLRDWVGKEIGPIAKPKDIRFGDNLPKTRSARSCGACCARSPRARRSRRTRRRWRTPPFSISWPSPIDARELISSRRRAGGAEPARSASRSVPRGRNPRRGTPRSRRASTPVRS
jgi:acyl-CoA synthetase (AMP-forming)/AMP-acid ligase II